MRRLGMMVVALMMVATMSFAQKVSDSKSMSFDKLSRYLQLDANQIAEVSEINTYFENQLGQPLSAEALCNNTARAGLDTTVGTAANLATPLLDNPPARMGQTGVDTQDNQADLPSPQAQRKTRPRASFTNVCSRITQRGQDAQLKCRGWERIPSHS